MIHRFSGAPGGALRCLVLTLLFSWSMGCAPEPPPPTPTPTPAPSPSPTPAGTPTPVPTCPDGFVLVDGDCWPADSDTDGDGVLDWEDLCPDVADADQADLDGDHVGDACDDDVDGDGVPDAQDVCPLIPDPDQQDLDSDSLGDLCDEDDDQDGIPDAEDVCPRDWDFLQADFDSDGRGDVCDEDDDGDGVPDDFDVCPRVVDPDQADSNLDGVGDACEDDEDGDGVPDGADNCPQNANPGQVDSDGDGQGNTCDPDDDEDGEVDSTDNCPLAPNPDQLDSNGDGAGDACDGDLDGDGLDDPVDNCPDRANATQSDLDGDGVGDLCDEDADGDGIPDGVGTIEPSGGSLDGGVPIEVTGSGFQVGAEVTVDGQPATEVAVLSPTRLVATTPSTSAGFVDVVITNPDGQIFLALQGYEAIQGTQLRGLVVDANLVPVANVQVDLFPTGGPPVQAVTGPDGRFTLTDTPSGQRTLQLDASLSSGPGGPSYPNLKVPVTLEEGRINLFGGGRPIYLPLLDTTYATTINPTGDTEVLSSPPSAASDLPGASILIPPGVAVDQSGAPYTGDVLISEVPQSRTPLAMGLGRRPAYIITVQPAGIEFTEPVPITFPNLDRLPAGRTIDIIGLDHDTGEFNTLGQGQVSADGLTIVTISGGVSTSSWHTTDDDPPDEDPDDDKEKKEDEKKDKKKDPCKKRAGSETDVRTGALQVKSDLLPWRAAGELQRLTLQYDSASAHPRPVLRVLARPPEDDLSQTMSYRLLIDGQDVAPEVFAYPISGPDRFTAPSYRSLSFDASEMATGSYAAQVVVSVNYWFSSFGAPIERRVVVRNERDSPLGVGWSLMNQRRIHPSADRLLVEYGDGTVVGFVRPVGPGPAEPPAGWDSTLDVLSDGTFLETAPDGSEFLYTSSGLLTSSTAPSGDAVSWFWDSAFRLSAITDAGGGVVTFDYEDDGRLSAITDPLGRVTTYAHDGEGHLTSITDPLGAVRTFAYDGDDRLINQVDARGGITDYRYGAAGQYVSSTLPDGSTRALVADGLVDLADPSGGTEAFPEPGLAADQIEGTFVDGAGRVFHQRSTPSGAVAERTGPDGATASFTYDDQGRLTQTVRADGSTESLLRDSVTDRIAERITTDPVSGDQRIVAFNWDPVSRKLVSTLDALGQETTFTLDAAGFPAVITDPLGRQVVRTFDDLGRVLTEESPGGLPQSFSWNPDGTQASHTLPGGGTISYTYSDGGLPTERVGADGDVTTWTYDLADRITSATDPEGGTATYTYDVAGGLTGITDPAGRERTFGLDVAGRAASIGDAAGSVTFEYDGEGNRTASVNAVGERIEYVYDDYDRMIEKDLPDQPPVTYQYDAMGRMVRAADGSTILEYDYDGLGRLTRFEMIGSPQIELNYTYDLAGQLLEVASTDGARDISYTYDDAGQLTSVGEAGHSVEFTLDVDGRPVQRTTSSGLREDVTWSDGGRPLTQDFSFLGAPIESRSYGWSPGGRRLSETDADGTHTWTMDGLSRVTGATQPWGNESYSYNPAGDRVSSHLSASYSYDTAGRLVEDDGWTYTWDAAGRLISRVDRTNGDAWSFDYDAEGRMIGVQAADSAGQPFLDASYRYDPVGRRIEKQVNGESTWYVWDGPALLAETTSDGIQLLRNVWDPSGRQPLWRVGPSGEAEDFLLDPAMTVLGLVDGSGTLVQRYTHDAFGQVLTQVAPDPGGTLGLHALLLDGETGFYSVGQRTYDPATGRFLSADPELGRLPSTASLNRWTFAADSPLDFTDFAGRLVESFLSLPFVSFKMRSDSNPDGTVSLCACASTDRIGISGGSEVSPGDNPDPPGWHHEAEVSAQAEASLGWGSGSCGAEAHAKLKLNDACSKGPKVDVEAGASIGCGDDARLSISSGGKVKGSVDVPSRKPGKKLLGFKLQASAGAESCSCYGW